VRAKGLIVVAVPLIALIGTTSASLALQYNERQERSAATAASGLSSAADAVNAESGVRDSSAPPALAAHADRQRFAQVLVNLISNAVKYNRRGGAITITCREGGASQASVVISDTGRGMRQEDLERIFAPFERLGADQTDIEGTGIGLPLAKALTEAMGGQLTTSSVLGEGSA
jgi:signal transduction histidine kinase